MKKVIFTLLSACVMSYGAYAQSCGNSGTAVCVPSGTLTEPGLSPNSADLPAVVRNVANTTNIQFKNFNQFNFGGQTVTVQSLKIDTISNIPSGLCWATNKSNDTYSNQEDGCIKVTGTTAAPAGQYKLYIVVTANIGVPIQTNADAAGLKYFVRVIDQGANTPCVDTNATASFVAYTGNEPQCVSAIGSISNNIQSLNIVPNPFNNKATVTFTTEKSGVYTQRITNMLGSEISKKDMNVNEGDFTTTIERKDLPVGIYFYTLTDGKSVVTKRFSISE